MSATTSATTITLPRTGETSAGTAKFGEYDKARTINLSGYVKPEMIATFESGGKKVTGLKVTIAPVFGD